MTAVGTSTQLYLNIKSAQSACENFIAMHETSLNENEIFLLHQLVDNWLRLIIKRTKGFDNLSLLHGDLHLFGNIFVRKNGTSKDIKIMDWAKICYGLGPHDLMYMLIPLETEDRKSRDTLYFAPIL
jgi:hypothetical protein